MNTILVSLWLKKDESTAALMPAELEICENWKAIGILDHLYAKENNSGAVLIFNESNESVVKDLMSTLPLFPYFEKIEYLPLDKLY